MHPGEKHGRAHEDGAATDTDLGSHSSTGRKGQWLGLEMDDTIGDNDGSIGGIKYFPTHDVRALLRLYISDHASPAVGDSSRAQGQGLFLRADAGRVVSAEKSSAEIPKEMLEHMKYLFSAFDQDNSGVTCARRSRPDAW